MKLAPPIIYDHLRDDERRGEVHPLGDGGRWYRPRADDERDRYDQPRAGRRRSDLYKIFTRGQ